MARILPLMLATILQAPIPIPTPSLTTVQSPDCLKASDLCRFVYDHTHNEWLASSSYYLLIKPLRILLIIVIAFVVRWLAAPRDPTG